jgi:hypothetical protein
MRIKVLCLCSYLILVLRSLLTLLRPLIKPNVCRMPCLMNRQARQKLSKSSSEVRLNLQAFVPRHVSWSLVVCRSLHRMAYPAGQRGTASRSSKTTATHVGESPTNLWPKPSSHNRGGCLFNWSWRKDAGGLRSHRHRQERPAVSQDRLAKCPKQSEANDM